MWDFQYRMKKGWLVNEDTGVIVPIEQSAAVFLSLLSQFQNEEKATDLMAMIGMIQYQNREVFMGNLLCEYNVFVQLVQKKELTIPSTDCLLQEKWAPIQAEDYVFPHTALVYLTHRCEMHCGYCYWKNKHHKGRELDFSDYQRMIDELIENGTSALVISGGEPFLYPDIISFLSYAAEKGMHIKVTTKHIFSDDEIQHLTAIDNRQLELIISLDTCDIQKSKILYGTNVFVQQMIDNLYTRKANKITFSLQPVVNKQTISEFSTLMEQFLDIGAKQIIVGCYTQTTKEKDAVFEISKTEWKQICELIQSQENNRITTLASEKHSKYCRAGNESITVLWNGAVVRCEHLEPEKNNLIGNITKQSILDIWKNRSFNKYPCILHSQERA